MLLNQAWCSQFYATVFFLKSFLFLCYCLKVTVVKVTVFYFFKLLKLVFICHISLFKLQHTIFWTAISSLIPSSTTRDTHLLNFYKPHYCIGVGIMSNSSSNLLKTKVINETMVLWILNDRQRAPSLGIPVIPQEDTVGTDPLMTLEHIASLGSTGPVMLLVYIPELRMRKREYSVL